MPRKKPPRKRTLASKADRYKLYVESVQSPENEVPFFNRVFRKEYGRQPLVLREDFCGTAIICREWVQSHRDRRAIGIDLDPEPMAWGRDNLLAELKPQVRDRISLIKGDVLTTRGLKADVLAAQNFSFFCFKTRDQLRGYFRAARRNLARQGVMCMDIMGGGETLEEGREETRRERGFKYVWEQKRFDPVTHDLECFIHFEFKDGSALRRAFHYQWRLWTIPELRELLLEAGFSRADVYWENTDLETEEGNGVFRRVESAPSDPAWVSYLVAVK
ncbi:MAG: class I SAM-dependent methyltransferase [Deltaproteobacteria bacterium]